MQQLKHCNDSCTINRPNRGPVDERETTPVSLATVRNIDDMFESRRRGPKPRGHDYSEDNYAPNQFYVKSTDGRGHGEKMSITLPPDVLGQIGAVVESKRFPYKTSHDLVRDAVLHRLHMLNEIQPGETLTEFLNQQRLLHLLEQQQMLIATARQTVERAKEHLTVAVDGEDWQVAVDAIRAASVTSEGMREPYHGALRKVIDDAARRLPRGWKKQLILDGVYRAEDE